MDEGQRKIHSQKEVKEIEHWIKSIGNNNNVTQILTSTQTYAYKHIVDEYIDFLSPSRRVTAKTCFRW